MPVAKQRQRQVIDWHEFSSKRLDGSLSPNGDKSGSLDRRFPRRKPSNN
ncbi:hypothetical protein [Chromobacterium piscinae]